MKGDGKGKGLPGPLLLSSCVCPSRVIIGMCHLVIACGVVMSSFCVGIMSSLGCVASSSSLRVQSCRHCGWSSSLVSLCCPCCIIVQCHCPCLAMCCPVSEKGGLGGMGDEGCSLWCPNNNEQHHCSSSGCHITDGDMAPGFSVREINVGR